MLRSVALVIAGIALLCGFGAAAFALTLEPSGTSTTPEYGWSIERLTRSTSSATTAAST